MALGFSVGPLLLSTKAAMLAGFYKILYPPSQHLRLTFRSVSVCDSLESDEDIAGLKTSKVFAVQLLLQKINSVSSSLSCHLLHSRWREQRATSFPSVEKVKTSSVLLPSTVSSDLKPCLSLQGNAQP